MRPRAGGPVELYDLRSDLGETTNLAEQKPQLVTKAVTMMAGSRSADSDWPDPATAPAPKRKQATQRR